MSGPRSIGRAYAAAYSGLPRATWILSLAVLVNRVGWMVVPFLTLYLTKVRGFDGVTAGWFVGLFGAGSILGTALGGWLTDRIGPVRVQILSLSAAAAGFVNLATLESPAAFAIALPLQGLVTDAFRPATSTLLTATCPTEKLARAFGLYRLAINVGVALGPILGGLLAEVDYRLLFVANGITCALGMIPLLVYFRGEHLPAPAPAAQPGGRSPLRDPLFLAVMLVSSLLGVAVMQMLFTLPLDLNRSFGFSERTIGLLFAINPTLIVLAEMLIVHRFERHHPLRIAATGALVAAVGLALLPWGRGVWFAALCLVVLTLGEMLESPQLATFVGRRAGAAHRGRYMAVYGMVFSVAMATAPALGMWTYDRFGPTVLWTSCALTCAVTGTAMFALAKLAAGEPPSPAVSAPPAAPTTAPAPDTATSAPLPPDARSAARSPRGRDPGSDSS